MEELTQSLIFWKNPLFLKGYRARLRSKQAFGWGLVTFVISLFLFLIVFSTSTNRGSLSTVNAGKAAFVPLLILQGILLMLLGTKSVAVGITQERDSGIIDFHRMTPMSVIPKLFGYLFGLPSREYMMFLITLPFTMAATYYGEISPTKVLHLYLVFFSTVWLYHMTGLMVGMLAKRPRNAGIFAQLTIIGLYLFMPQLARFGFTFLGFLTVLPAYYGILLGELQTSLVLKPTLLAQLQQWQQVPFFEIVLHPTLYTLSLQGLLFLSFFGIVRRKWMQERNHAFSKLYALAFYALFQVLLVGSLWPFLARPERAEHLQFVGKIAIAEPAFFLSLIFYIFFFLSGLISLILINSISPEWDTFLKGLRRSKKKGFTRIPRTSDAASGYRYTFVLLVMTLISYTVFWSLLLQSGKIVQQLPNYSALIGLPLLFAGLLFCIQAAREYWGRQGLLLFFFFYWIFPVLGSLLMLSVSNAYIEASYLSTFAPVSSFLFSIMYLISDIITNKTKLTILSHGPNLTYLGIALQLIPAFLLSFLLHKKKQKVVKESD